MKPKSQERNWNYKKGNTQQVQEVQKKLKHDQKHTKLRHIIVKLLKIKDNILKANRAKKQWITADFLLKTMRARRQLNWILHLAKISLKSEEKIQAFSNKNWDDSLLADIFTRNMSGMFSGRRVWYRMDPSKVMKNSKNLPSFFHKNEDKYKRHCFPHFYHLKR